MTELVKLSQISMSCGTQCRETLNEQIVSEYAELLCNGVTLTPAEVVFDGDTYYPADGWHRLKAAASIGWDRYPCNITAGSLDDARWMSAAANAKHGLRRTRADVRRAIRMALMHPRGKNLADREVGRHVGADGKTVASVRAELVATAESPQSAVRTGADGRQIDTARIGQRPAECSPAASDASTVVQPESERLEAAPSEAIAPPPVDAPSVPAPPAIQAPPAPGRVPGLDPNEFHQCGGRWVSDGEGTQSVAWSSSLARTSGCLT